MGRLLDEDNVIDTLNVGAELLRRILDETDVVGAERAKYEWGLELIESYISDMKELPSAESERKKGKWIIDPLWSTIGGVGGVYRTLRCSECNHQEPWPWLTRRYFCPNCGADMR